MKKTKKEALYIKRTTRWFCRRCKHYIPSTKTCTIVEGAVSPNGNCKYWSGK